ncbi:hypothetical protein D9M68_872850 [compost metagenome]
MPPSEADQILVQVVHRPAGRCQFCGAGGERRTDGVVSAGALLLDAAEGLLVAVVDAGRPAHGQEDGERQRQLVRVRQLAGQSGDVVVAHERERHEGVQEPVVPLERGCEFVEVGVVE